MNSKIPSYEETESKHRAKATHEALQKEIEVLFEVVKKHGERLAELEKKCQEL